MNITEQAFPLGWKEDLERTLDFEAAFAALEGYEHFHSYTLKGTLRHVQLRLDEAIDLFDKAEARFSSFEPTPQNQQLYVWLLGSRLSTRIFQEALSGSSASMTRTDDELDRFLSIEGISPVQRDKNVAFYNLLRGDYEEALVGFEKVIEATRRTPERCIGSYICASAAAYEIGSHRESRRHYENAELTMCCSCNRFVFSVYLTWLLALCEHWGWDGERQRWSDTISVLECPEVTRKNLFHRAELMQEICSSAHTVVFA